MRSRGPTRCRGIDRVLDMTGCASSALETPAEPGVQTWLALHGAAIALASVEVSNTRVRGKRGGGCTRSCISFRMLPAEDRI